MASLRRTGKGHSKANNSPIVNHMGLMDGGESWQPFRQAIRVEVSPSSWAGLHSRVLSSPQVKVEAA